MAARLHELHQDPLVRANIGAKCSPAAGNAAGNSVWMHVAGVVTPSCMIRLGL